MARRGEFRLDSEYPHGVDDVTFDCRCYGESYADLVSPWAALSSQANWGEDPNELPDGDVDRLDYVGIEGFAGEPIPVEHFDTDFFCSCRYCERQKEDELHEGDEMNLEEWAEEQPEDVVDCPIFTPDDDASLCVEYFPKTLSSGIVRAQHNCRADVRQGRGKRGDNRYKLLRRGRVRLTTRKHNRLTRIVPTYEVVVRQRVVCHNGRTQ